MLAPVEGNWLHQSKAIDAGCQFLPDAFKPHLFRLLVIFTFTFAGQKDLLFDKMSTLLDLWMIERKSTFAFHIIIKWSGPGYFIDIICQFLLLLLKTHSSWIFYFCLLLSYFPLKTFFSQQFFYKYSFHLFFFFFINHLTSHINHLHYMNPLNKNIVQICTFLDPT